MVALSWIHWPTTGGLILIVSIPLFGGCGVGRAVAYHDGVLARVHRTVVDGRVAARARVGYAARAAAAAAGGAARGAAARSAAAGRVSAAAAGRAAAAG